MSKRKIMEEYERVKRLRGLYSFFILSESKNVSSSTFSFNLSDDSFRR
jgi:hypothetical protein